MIWLAWRQMRTQIIVVFALLVALAIDLQISGAHIIQIYNTLVVPCSAHGDCAEAQQRLSAQSHWIHPLGALVLVLPGLLGIFWGAPLVARELETGTYRLVWTQSVSRLCWFLVKFGFVGLASVAVAGVASVLVTRWASPVDLFNNDPFQTFDVRDVVPVAYTAFAFALGVSAGVLIRRTLPAMAATLVAFIGARYAVYEWVRPRLVSTLVFRGPYQGPVGNGPVATGSPAVPANAWTISDQVVNAAGHVVGENGAIGPNGLFGFSRGANGVVTFAGMGRCPNKFPSQRPAGFQGGPTQVSPALIHATQVCVKSFHLREIVTYQPASHYWALQWSETAVFGALALALGGFSLWMIRRRLP